MRFMSCAVVQRSRSDVEIKFSNSVDPIDGQFFTVTVHQLTQICLIGQLVDEKFGKTEKKFN